jgi:hypothetical protein
MECAVEIGSGGMIYEQSFMKTGIWVQEILKFFLSSFSGYNVGITDERDLRYTPLYVIRMYEVS